MIDQKKPEYKTYDYSAVNAHAEEMIKRERAATWAKRSKNFKVYSRYTALLLVAVGIMAVLFGYAYYLAFEKEFLITANPTKDIENIEKIDKGDLSKDKKIRELQKKLTEKERQRQKTLKYTKNYTKFQTVEDIKMFSGLIVNVVTGHNYKSSKDKSPNSQYCYASHWNGLTGKRVNLAKIDEKGKYITFVQEHRKAWGNAAASHFEVLVQYCQFTGTAGTH